MRCFLAITVTIFLIFTCGCGNQDKNLEPTPNFQAKLEANTKMETWFTEVRFLAHFTFLAIDKITERLEMVERGGSRGALVAVIDYYNSAGSWNKNFQEKFTALEQHQKEIEKNPEADQAMIKNIIDAMMIMKKVHGLGVSYPENANQFISESDKYREQFKALEKLLQVRFPQSESSLQSMMSSERPEYRQLKKLIEDIPEFEQIEETGSADTDQNIPSPTPSPVYKSPQIFRDEQGRIVIGQSETSPAPGNPSLDEQTQIKTDSNQSPEPQKSVIWQDDQGNLHMGSKAPEGAVVKNAEDIPIMIVR